MINKQVVLRDPEIRITIKRMVLQIAENYVDISQLTLVGLNERGSFLATLIRNGLNEVLPNLEVGLEQLTVVKDMPASDFKFDIVDIGTKPVSQIVAAGTKYESEMFISATSSTIVPKMRWKQLGSKDGFKHSYVL